MSLTPSDHVQHVYLNGEFLPRDQARLSVDERGSFSATASMR